MGWFMGVVAFGLLTGALAAVDSARGQAGITDHTRRENVVVAVLSWREALTSGGPTTRGR